MNITEWIGVFTSTLGISTATAAFLARTLVEHRLKKELDREKASWEGQIRERVETILGDRAADREYTLEARKRLYKAIGPLRFQLLLACRDLAERIKGAEIAHYLTNIEDYYGMSYLYRILRPLALTELVKRQVTYADFSVDESAVNLIRFNRTASEILKGGDLVDGRQDVNWNEEKQHVFSENLNRAVNAIILRDEDGTERCMNFHEFQEFCEDANNLRKIEPFPDILAGFSPGKKPLFWLRLVCYAFICNEFINQEGVSIGFEKRDFPLMRLLEITRDPEISGNLTKYERRCRNMLEMKL